MRLMSPLRWRAPVAYCDHNHLHCCPTSDDRVVVVEGDWGWDFLDFAFLDDSVDGDDYGVIALVNVDDVVTVWRTVRRWEKLR